MNTTEKIHPRYAAVVAHREAWAARLASMSQSEIAGLEAALSDRQYGIVR
jgi:hypothetical protein